MLMMDLYEEPCMLPDMIESDLQTDLGCGGELGSTHLPPLEGMGALDSLDPSWLSDPHGPLNSDLDSLDVGLMVNPQTGLPSLSSSSSMNTVGGVSAFVSSSSSSAALSSQSPVRNSLPKNSPSTISSNHSKKTTGGFTLLTASSNSTINSQPQTTLSVGNSALAATPVVSNATSGGGITQISASPQPLTGSNVQALLGQYNQANNRSQQPAAKKSRMSEFEEIQAPSEAGLIIMSPSPRMGFPKPAYSYSCLIAMALKNSKTGSLPVNEIYNFMIENFPYFKTAPNGWKNSVRHNLSLNKCFEKIEKPTTGPNGTQRKGCLWAMNPSKVGKMDEEVQKWSKKDPVLIRRSMANPDRLELLEKGFLKDLYTGGDSLDDDDEEEVEDTVSSVEDDIESMLPDTPPTSQDESGGGVKVKFESSPWDTWETLQQQDENKLDSSNFASTAFGGVDEQRQTISTGSSSSGGSALFSTSDLSSNKKGINGGGSSFSPRTHNLSSSFTTHRDIGGNMSTVQSSTLKMESKLKAETSLIR